MPAAVGALAIEGDGCPDTCQAALRLLMEMDSRTPGCCLTRIWVGDKDYSAPSAAAVGAAMDLGAKGGALNGWYWWEFETPAGSGK